MTKPSPFSPFKQQNEHRNTALRTANRRKAGEIPKKGPNDSQRASQFSKSTESLNTHWFSIAPNHLVPLSNIPVTPLSLFRTFPLAQVYIPTIGAPAARTRAYILSFSLARILYIFPGARKLENPFSLALSARRQALPWTL